MIKNYFKTAWRSLLRNKSYAAINVTGLAVGIAACMLIFLVVHFETSFDNFHTSKNRIYRVVTAFSSPDGISFDSGTPLPTADGLRIDFPQLPVAAIMKNSGSHYSIASRNGGAAKKFKEDDSYYAEPQFFKIFNFAWLAGNASTALTEPGAVVLSRSEAEKFFGDWHNAIGKTIRYENKKDLKVTGILEDVPVNTDFPLKLVISYATLKQKDADYAGNMNDWVSTFGDHHTYIVLSANFTPAQFNQSLIAFAKKHKPAEFAKDSFRLQALSDMHFNTQVQLFSNHPFSRQLINAISLIGAFLLIIACVNFINLATAQAVNRAKEVGVRKVLGSNRSQLVIQFVSETFIITLLAVVLAVGLAQLAIPFLNKLLEVQISKAFLAEPVLLLFLFATLVTVTLLSGLYPALILSGFNPIAALKSRIAASSSGGISLRRVLVVLQFCIAQVLVIGTLVIIHQMDFFRNKSLGFDKDAVITTFIPGDSVARAKLNSLKDELMKQPGVKDVSYSFASPSDFQGWGAGFKFNNSPKNTDFSANLKWADAEYFKLYKLDFVAGQPYGPSDTTNGYVVNQALIKKLGIRNPQDAIGKYISLFDIKKNNFKITGVVKDFNIGSLKDAIPPVILGSSKNTYQTINIKIQPANISQTLAAVETEWNSTFPDGLYEYRFLDDKIASFYKSENQLSQLYKIFAGIAIFISCLGLYGLVSFMAVQRTREVGIRKTLGASISSIVYLFSKEFTLLVIVAFALAAPLGWYFMHQWLQGFTYRITLGPEIFVLAIIASITIAWITVGYKAVTAAMANPVKSLKSE